MTYISDATNITTFWKPTHPTIPTAKGKGKMRCKGKVKNTDAENHISKQGIIEHHGVMFMYKKELEKMWNWLKQIDGRHVSKPKAQT